MGLFAWMENSLWGGSLPFWGAINSCSIHEMQDVSIWYSNKAFFSPFQTRPCRHPSKVLYFACLIMMWSWCLLLVLLFEEIGADPISISLYMIYLSEGEFFLWIGLPDWLLKLFLFQLKYCLYINCTELSCHVG